MSLIRIGTRGSELARTQSGWVADRLREAHPGLTTELVLIKTTGDRITDRPLSEVGGKGLFVKEIEEALLAGTIDCAVHSLKDMPVEMPTGLILASVPPREDPRDALITRDGGGLASLARGARLGTSSLRRASLVRALRPDLDVQPLRGNVDTRLRKVRDGEVDATLLAMAGLRRLGANVEHAEPLDPSEFVPAIGQGALALESRVDRIADILRAIEHQPSRQAADAERAFLIEVGGSCVTPLAAHAIICDGRIELSGFIARPDGGRILRGRRTGAVSEGEALGRDLARELLDSGGAEILRGLAAR